MKNLLAAVFVLLCFFANAELKLAITPTLLMPIPFLELESTKGFLPPRVALNSISSVSPLTGTVPAGMLVFSSGGTLANGFYYWRNGTEWKLLSTGESNVVSKTANATLTKTETFILASNDITITLPTVTVADNGLSITVKNVGTHTDLITVQGNGGATIDDITTSKLTRYIGQTFVATGGNWVIKGKGLMLKIY